MSSEDVYLADIETDITTDCARFIYDRDAGRKTAFLHYRDPDRVEIWDLNPAQWRGWRRGFVLKATKNIDKHTKTHYY